MEVQDIDWLLQELGKDYFFLFCARYSNERLFFEDPNKMMEHKEASCVIILDIVERWSHFPNPSKILKMSMENIICMTFLNPVFPENKKNMIIRGILHPLARLYGPSEEEKEALRQEFYKMVKRLLAESPNIETLSCLLNALTFFYNRPHQGEKAVAKNAIRELLAYAIKFNNMPGEAISAILAPQLTELFNTINEADIQVEDVDVFPAMYQM